MIRECWCVVFKVNDDSSPFLPIEAEEYVYGTADEMSEYVRVRVMTDPSVLRHIESWMVEDTPFGVSYLDLETLERVS